MEYVLEYVTNNVTVYQSDDGVYEHYMLEHVSCDKQHYITSYFCNHIRFYFTVYHDFLEHRMVYWLDKYLELKLCYLYNYVKSYLWYYDNGVEF